MLPGVGHAGHAMRRLEALGLLPVIDRAVAGGRPFLGICLGMQLLFDDQEEGEGQGLGLLPGRVRSLRGPVKVPHIGWNRVRLTTTGPLGARDEADYFYFVHSFIAEPDDPADVAAETEYGECFPSVVVRDNVWGTQFHPEKSGPAGLALIRTWVEQIGTQAGSEAPLREAVPA